MRLIQLLSMNILGQWGGGLLTVPGGGGGLPVSARELRAVLPACTVHCPHPTTEQGISAASHFPWRH